MCHAKTDMQLITGASIFIILFSTHCTITQYHYYIGSRLGYMSIVTFQAVFMAIRTDLQAHPFKKKLWCYIWKIILFGAVLFSRFLVWNDVFLVSGLYGASVQCVLDNLGGGRDTTMSLYLAYDCLLLCWGFWGITECLFPNIKRFTPFFQLGNLRDQALSWSSRRLMRLSPPKVRESPWQAEYSVLSYLASLFYFNNLFPRTVSQSWGFKACCYMVGMKWYRHVG